MPPPPSKPIRLLVLLLGVLIALSAVGLAGAAVALPRFSPGQKPAWMLFGFEVVVLVAGVLGVLFGRGAFRAGPGMTLACIAGTILLATKFGAISANNQIGTQSLSPVFAARALVALLIGAAAAVCVLSRNRKSWKPAIWGGALGVPVLAACAVAAKPGGRRAIEAAINGSTVVAILAVVGAVILAILLCASVHLLIRAFEMGRVEDSAVSGPGNAA